jgi:hypothetical protein
VARHVHRTVFARLTIDTAIGKGKKPRVRLPLPASEAPSPTPEPEPDGWCGAQNPEPDSLPETESRVLPKHGKRVAAREPDHTLATRSACVSTRRPVASDATSTARDRGGTYAHDFLRGWLHSSPATFYLAETHDFLEHWQIILVNFLASPQRLKLQLYINTLTPPYKYAASSIFSNSRRLISPSPLTS